MVGGFIIIAIVILFALWLSRRESTKEIDSIDLIPDNYSFSVKHNPTGEEWYCIVKSNDKKRICVAGWPPTIAYVSDCSDFEPHLPLTEEEIKYRTKQFGNEWK